MRSRVLAVASFVVLSATPLQAQHTADTSRVEFIGLRSWTVAMIRDSLARYAPGTSIGSTACGELLRNRFHFAEAGVLRYPDGSVVVSVIEPADARRVVPRRFAPTASEAREEWRALADLRTRDFDTYRFAIDTYLASAQPRDSLLRVTSVDSVSVRRIWSSLQTLAADGSGSPRHVLATDSNRDNRVMAAAVLVSFSHQDDAWRSLLEALADADGQVRVSARMSLWSMSKARPRAIDWAPSVPAIRLLLNGTSIVWSTEVQRILLSTQVAPQLRQHLLNPMPELLLAQAAASHQDVGGTARRFLERLTGQSFGNDTTAWRRWAERAER